MWSLDDCDQVTILLAPSVDPIFLFVQVAIVAKNIVLQNAKKRVIPKEKKWPAKNMQLRRRRLLTIVSAVKTIGCMAVKHQS
ncbi:MAG: hypothetical protein B7Y39_16675 [Bdellovibrio sp. 28-41-41]|nr:MAG: hypothetical protein B7Y39_16675 [Bdellovibrio sp. 28-41-41]